MEEQVVKRLTDIVRDAKDISDVRKDIQKIVFAYNNSDKETKKKVIKEIYQSYYWMSGAIALLTDTVIKTFRQMSDDDYRYILRMQYSFLLAYEAGETIEFLKKEDIY